MSSKDTLTHYLTEVSKELDKCIKFWTSYSHDVKYGGFFNCLSSQGTVYDETKYGWLQGRQVWTYCRLYNEFPRFHKDDILQAAVKGGEFLMRHIKDPKTSRCFFSTTRDGRPIKMQRTIFTEVFYVLGLSELSMATKNAVYKKEATDMMNMIIHWVRVNDSAINKQKLSGIAPTNSMAIPIVLMNLIQQMERMDEKFKKEYSELREWCVKELLSHVQRDGTCVLENVTPDGKEMTGCQGRLMNPVSTVNETEGDLNGVQHDGFTTPWSYAYDMVLRHHGPPIPIKQHDGPTIAIKRHHSCTIGHAIEAGWFLLEYAVESGRKDLQDIAIKNFIKGSFKTGWDGANGGLYYMLDADGHCPTQLEWNMKLWWPHNEALIAFLMAYKATVDEECLKKFSQVFDYCWSHFVDSDAGEWFGYLNTKGEKSSTFKGGPFKGCFHLPRCLLMCEQMLQSIIDKT